MSAERGSEEEKRSVWTEQRGWAQRDLAMEAAASQEILSSNLSGSLSSSLGFYI
jgi:hypothetical protein